jgi:hypothetical protein
VKWRSLKEEGEEDEKEEKERITGTTYLYLQIHQCGDLSFGFRGVHIIQGADQHTQSI